jgi:hypothetical protein
MKKIFASLIFVFITASVCAQNTLEAYAVAFYNVENLYDAEKDPKVIDDDFTPEGANRWTEEKYRKKLQNISHVISKLAREHCPSGPAVLGLAEVENRRVLEDLIASKDLLNMKLGIVHYDSPDRRGVDVALLYNQAMFRVISSKIYPYVYPEQPGFKSRDQLLVSGAIGGEKIHIVVCHWPSRVGDKSADSRKVAAEITKRIVDSLHNEDKNAKIIIMGDLNDDPSDLSCKTILNAKRQQAETESQGLFSTMWNFYDRGIGSLAYQDKWSLFDQIIVSHGLLGKDRTTLKFWKAEIFNRDFLLQKEGKNKGYPFRTFSGNQFTNGYSDHFPTLIYLVKKH